MPARTLSAQATGRLADLLDLQVTIERLGQDQYGRTLAVVFAGGRNVGDVLIAERLARRWQGHREDWCGSGNPGK